MIDFRLRPLWQLSQQLINAPVEDLFKVYDAAEDMKSDPRLSQRARQWLNKRLDEEQELETQHRRRGLHVCN